MFITNQYTQEQMRALFKEGTALMDRLITLEVEAFNAGNEERADRIHAIGRKASVRWQRREKKAAYPTPWEYGLEGDSAYIFEMLVRGRSVDVMGDVPFRIEPQRGIDLRWYKVIPHDTSKKGTSVKMLEWWEVASWAGSLTLPPEKEAQS
jgi:hypothetical protein